MKKYSLLVAAALASLSVAAHAAHGGGGHMGASSSMHMSGQGVANTNGSDAADRDHGLARAGDRRNAEGSGHEQADTAQGSHRHLKQPGKSMK